MLAAPEVRVDPSSGPPVALARDGAAWVSVHSRRDPLAEAHRQAGTVEPDAPVLVVVGLGLGWLLDALEARQWQGRVLALEPFPALIPALKDRRDWSAWDARLTMVPLADETAPDDLWRVFTAPFAPPPVLVNPVAGRLAPALVARAHVLVERARAEALANDNARRANAGLYLLNTLRNRQAIGHGADVASLTGVCAGWPAIVVGAGPSLDDNASVIAAHRDRALVIAVDTALRPLLAAGVTPDLVVAVDPTDANARHLTDLPPLPHTWLVAEGSLAPEAIDAFAGRTFFCRVGNHAPWPWLSSQGAAVGEVRSWGSVLTTAFDVALQVGANPIVFAGADLAFSGGQPYARGTRSEEDWARAVAWGADLRGLWRQQVADWAPVDEPAVNGRTEPTATHLRAFRDWIVRHAARHPDRTVVNGSGRGILAGPSISQVVLARFLARLPPMAPAAASVLAARYRPGGVTPGTPEQSLRTAWAADIGVSLDAIANALGEAPPMVASAADRFDRVRRLVPEADAVLTPGDFQILSGLLTRGEATEVVVHTDPGQSLDDAVAPLAASLASGGTMAIVDAAGDRTGSAVRRTLDTLVANDSQLFYDDRRFVDHASRLTLLRRVAPGAPPRWADADRAKAGPAETEAAARLAPVVSALLAPQSVVDVGCGDGAWNRALQAAGVRSVTSIPAARCPALLTPTDGDAADVPKADVALCLEVAHELAPDDHARLVRLCTGTADTVVFSSRVPGTPGESRWARPLPYWVARFWDEGFILDDCVRPELEARFGAVRSTADLMVVFRRCPALADPAARHSDWRAFALDHAARIHDLIMQAVWLRVSAARTEASSVTPVGPCEDLPIRPADMRTGLGLGRRVVLMTDQGRWVAAHGSARFVVSEDGVPLREVGHPRDLGALKGTWWRERDVFHFTSSDGTDPRANGRRYALRLPAWAAQAEAAARTSGAAALSAFST